VSWGAREGMKSPRRSKGKVTKNRRLLADEKDLEVAVLAEE